MSCIARRDAILDAALRRFDRYGYRKTTMAEIAREAGVSVGALYLVFNGKEEILRANAERRCRQLLDQMRAAGRRSNSLPEKLENVALTRALFLWQLCESSALGYEMVQALEQRYCPQHEGMFCQQRRVIEEILEEGVRLGVFDVEDVTETATCFYVAFTAWLPPQSARMEEAELLVRIRQMTGLLVNGLRKR